MDEIRNPFAPDAGTPPPELAGRDDILSEAHIAMQRALRGRSARSLMLIGLRGTGKTVLLNRIANDAEQAGMLTLHIEAPENDTFARQFAIAAKSTLLRLSHIEMAKALAVRGLRGVASFISTLKLSHGEITIAVDPLSGHADSGDLDTDMTELMLMVGEAARAAGRGWAIFIDEVQYLDAKGFSALVTALHRCNQRQLPICFVGAGLPLVPRLAGEAKSYAERIFLYPKIGSLSRSGTEIAIRKPIEDEGENIADEAIDEIMRVTNGYPFFLQEWGYQSWNIAERSPITVEDVKTASNAALRRLDAGFYRVRTDRMTPREREICEVMAEMGAGPYAIGEVAAKLGVELKSLSLHRSNLIKKGMIYSSGTGKIDFTVPMFDAHLRRVFRHDLGT